METNEIVTFGMQLKKLFQKKYEPIIQKYDLRPVEIDILVFLDKRKHMDTAKEIIQGCHLSKAHVSKSIDNLKSRGFVDITEDEDDRRILHICLTDKSKEVIDMAMESCTKCREVMLKDISKEDIDVVKNVISKISDNIIEDLNQ